MKAEPESRIEKGKDIKFSIDDLAAKDKPEPWDGRYTFFILLCDTAANLYLQVFEHIQHATTSEQWRKAILPSFITPVAKSPQS